MRRFNKLRVEVLMTPEQFEWVERMRQARSGTWPRTTIVTECIDAAIAREEELRSVDRLEAATAKVGGAVEKIDHGLDGVRAFLEAVMEVYFETAEKPGISRETFLRRIQLIKERGA